MKPGTFLQSLWEQEVIKEFDYLSIIENLYDYCHRLEEEVAHLKKEKEVMI